MAPLGLGIIGCGWAAGEIVRATGELAELRSIVVFDVDASRSVALAAKAGASVAPSVEALIADSRVEIVYVGLPHRLLPGAVELALRAGRHVLAEKPLALDAAEARRLGRLASEQHLKLGVFFELRRAGTVEAARKLLAEGAIGTPRLVRIRTLIDKSLSYWGPPGALNWRSRQADAGGGVVMMNTIHQLDALRYVTGLDYTNASGQTAIFSAPGDVEDSASATLTLSNGGLVSLVASAHAPGASHAETIEIDGTLGRLDLPDPFGTAPLRLWRSASHDWTDIPAERGDSHRLMLEAFAASILAGTPEPAGAEDAARALGAVNAIYRSSAEGRTVEIS